MYNNFPQVTAKSIAQTKGLYTEREKKKRKKTSSINIIPGTELKMIIATAMQKSIQDTNYLLSDSLINQN